MRAHLPVVALVVCLRLGAPSPVAAQDTLAMKPAVPVSDSIVHLPSGDSLEFQATAPVMVLHQAVGIMYVYHPFFPLSDTAHVRRIAVEFAGTLIPSLTTLPRFVAMRAVDAPAALRNQGGAGGMHFFGVVLRHRDDGHWYGLHSETPVF